ncbi:MAG TPA: serine/threonine-protein kinase [Solimonas sp.]|nr:serine/threonine-protein kinase [Solimonas sp.]
MNDTLAITQLGRYQIRRELGRGAMGVVYEAKDPLLDRTVAVKTIMLSRPANNRVDYEAQFFQEARAAARLNHPSIITIFDVGREGDLAYMAMELLPGIDLRQRLRADGLPLREALTLAAEIADGLGFAHEHGVEHRDIKPANIMMSHKGHAKIMDFGIARLQQSDVKTTQGEVLLGTPRYMSPEQVVGRPVDHRSDIFSLGSVLYEMLVGYSPFDGADTAQLWRNIATARHVPPSELMEGVPALLDQIVDRALAKPSAARYQNAYEMAADLRRCLAECKDRPAPSRQIETRSRGVPVAEVAIPHWPLASHFDSMLALQRLTEPGDADRERLQRQPRPLQGAMRLWRDRDLRLAGAIVGASLLTALLIAFG